MGLLWSCQAYPFLVSPLPRGSLYTHALGLVSTNIVHSRSLALLPCGCNSLAFSAAKKVQGRLLLKIARVLLLLLLCQDRFLLPRLPGGNGGGGVVARFACGLEPGKAPWLENRTGSLLCFQLSTVGAGVASG